MNLKRKNRLSEPKKKSAEIHPVPAEVERNIRNVVENSTMKAIFLGRALYKVGY